VGALLVTEPPKSPAPAKGKKAVEIPGVTVGAALKTSQFWLMWGMIVASASAGLNVASMFKNFAGAQPALKGDSYQALVGGMGALFNGIGRLFWGSVSDKIGFKLSFTILTLLQAVIQLFYNQSGLSKPGFMVANCLSYFCLAGTFAMMPPAIQRMFGPKNGALIYGVIYSAFGVASVGGSYLSKVSPCHCCCSC
jgi:OFA family oxalate/formate antiporter-like MFS transporter